MPPLGFNGTQNLPEPYQAYGARCVITLSSQLLSAILPAGTPFFRLAVPSKLLVQSGQMATPEETNRGLALSELLLQSEIERRAWRQPTSVSLQLLIVTGNSLEYIQPDNSIRVYRLDQYCVCRDVSGNVVEIVIQEKVSPLALPPRARDLVPEKKPDAYENDVELYTWCRRLPNGVFECHQEINGDMVPGSKGTYKTLPFLPLRWGIVPGEDYGRAKIEEHWGDLRAFEDLSKAMLDGAALAARHVTMIKPNATGTNLAKKVAKANNGDVIVGDFEAVKMLQFENVVGLQIAQQELARLGESLASAFMLNSALRRNAERVTAEEIRRVAEELETNLGGVYSLLSQDMQAPRVERLIMQMQANGDLPKWNPEQVEPQITTGLEALNREKDVMRVQAAAQISQMLDPQQEYTKTGDLLKKAYVGLGLPAAVRTEEEAQQLRQQRAQAMAMARQQVGPPGAQPEQPTGTNG